MGAEKTQVFGQKFSGQNAFLGLFQNFYSDLESLGINLEST